MSIHLNVSGQNFIFFLWKIAAHVYYDFRVVENELDVNMSFPYKMGLIKVVVYKASTKWAF